MIDKKCKTCNKKMRGSMYKHNNSDICRDCVFEVLKERKNEE